MQRDDWSILPIFRGVGCFILLHKIRDVIYQHKWKSGWFEIAVSWRPNHQTHKWLQSHPVWECHLVPRIILSSTLDLVIFNFPPHKDRGLVVVQDWFSTLGFTFYFIGFMTLYLRPTPIIWFSSVRPVVQYSQFNQVLHFYHSIVRAS